MADTKENPQQQPPPPPPPPPHPLFLEVSCKSTGKVRRFAEGTKASFALSLINNKVQPGGPLALYIQAVKSGEEPIYFGPTSPLVSYGHGWTLQTVLDSQSDTIIPDASKSLNDGLKKQASEPGFSFLFVGKIVVVFLFIFLLGGIFTFALESLPDLLLYINSSL